MEQLSASISRPPRVVVETAQSGGNVAGKEFGLEHAGEG
jgi:hypothetical protein